MRYPIAALIILIYFLSISTLLSQEENMEYRKLAPEEEKVILHKGMEMPFIGKYNDFL